MQNDIPEALYRRIKESAETSRRSINAEMLERLERSFTSRPVDPEAFLVRARRRQEKMELPWVTDADLRRARGSGRP
ncbi:MAG: Arc family DNA-binding protein [Gemmatimonadetes bacterium]|nr:Arc family DNA-binding protein [Gemmatimonadota bacterium]NIR78876.1 Arc family DNA-binding protein [Gemmatimonadota bacterium]NIT87522.1 Arc family DNA-binding protein [Gemmatimonadota bacterium]NIU31389.1 Arc family DNA-binding protein [Gemmatimonadota bacterium]NIU36064.1 Arc family DNA-binding protein [Gemmatimonadota bacterium]